VFRERVERIAGHEGFDPAGALAVWEAGLAATPWRGPAVWLHGDLHPANVLVNGPVGLRRVSAVIDFGDLTGGDPATDLGSAWMFLPTTAVRRRFRDVIGGVDDATWTRARAWALNHGVACVEGAADEPVIAAMGARTIDNALAGA
jgi:aminoglycoside phosphotransferase (APT) family kinase protein